MLVSSSSFFAFVKVVKVEGEILSAYTSSVNSEFQMMHKHFSPSFVLVNFKAGWMTGSGRGKSLTLSRSHLQKVPRGKRNSFFQTRKVYNEHRQEKSIMKQILN